jgi:hypothetical protein
MPHWLHPDDRIRYLKEWLDEHIGDYIELADKTSSYSVDTHKLAKDAFETVVDNNSEMITSPESLSQWLADHIGDYIELGDKRDSYSADTDKLAKAVLYNIADTDIPPPGGRVVECADDLQWKI